MLIRLIQALRWTLPMAFLFATTAQAYEIPYNNTGIKYFYVFGSEGDPLMGKEDTDTQEIYIDVPESATGNVEIKVFDPDTSGFVDWRTDVNMNPWNTATEFTVYGSGQLDSKTFGEDSQYDQQYYTFGPYDKEQGEKVGDKYRFRLVAKGLSGDDQNLFKVSIAPESAESFVYQMTFRLLNRQGDLMNFYPQIPAGVDRITIYNYDLDREGGTSHLLTGSDMRRQDISDSRSGEWVETEVDLRSNAGGRTVYRIVKSTQRHGNAGVKIQDASGKQIPIYFQHGNRPMIPAAPAPAPKIEPKQPGPKCNTYTFDGRKSYDQDNQKIAYFWDFGDGTTSAEPVVTHTFPDAGDYVVSLTITDNSGLVCNTDVSTTPITVNTPPKASFTSPDIVCVNESVYVSGSGTTDNTPDAMVYDWDLGDGSTAQGVAVDKVYAKGGTYKIRLHVDDSAGSACSQDAAERLIRVNTPPIAAAGNDVAMCLKSASAGFDVKFDAAGSSDADREDLTYAWDFGDGTKGEGARPSHVYAKEGDYRATVTVTDPSGANCNAAVDSVNVSLNSSPAAVAGPDVNVCQGNEVNFDASDSYDAGEGTLDYHWDFGDGSTGTGRTASHKYEKSGNYRVVLTVDDGKGTTCSIAKDEVLVSVNGAPQVSVSQPKAACLNNTVSFDAEAADADGDGLELTWDFGDGTVVKGGNHMTHNYAKGGYYTVKVTADDKRGRACSTTVASSYVEINTPPAANAGDNLVCCQGQEVGFDASKSADADSDALTYNWNFGDGNTATGAKVKHTYQAFGSYDVRVTVNDGSETPCSESADGFKAVVNAKPVSIIEVR